MCRIPGKVYNIPSNNLNIITSPLLRFIQNFMTFVRTLRGILYIALRLYACSTEQLDQACRVVEIRGIVRKIDIATFVTNVNSGKSE